MSAQVTYIINLLHSDAIRFRESGIKSPFGIPSATSSISRATRVALLKHAAILNATAGPSICTNRVQRKPNPPLRNERT